MTLPARAAKATLVAAAHFLALGTSAGAAESVFRCGNSYSQVPCAQGQAVDVDDARSDSQRAAAREVAAREATLAAQMTRDRERAEAGTRVGTIKAVRTKTLAVAAVPTPTPTRRPKGKARNTDGSDFVAFVPKPVKPAAAKRKGG